MLNGAGRRRLPHGPSWPTLAHTAAMWLCPLAALQRFRRQHGDRFTLRNSVYPPLVFLSDPAEIREVFVASEAQLRPGEGARTISPLVGLRSFMLSDGEEHRLGRKAVLSAFRASAIGRHEQMVREVAERALAGLPCEQPIALHPRLRALTLEVILRTVAGRFDGPLGPNLRLLRERVLDMLDITTQLAFVEPRLRQGPGAAAWDRFLRTRAEVDELVYALIGERSPGHADVIGTLAAQRNADGSPATPKQIHDNVMSVILAGHETTASQLAWAFQLLAHSPRVQRAIVDEMSRGTGDAYLTATIQEVLRRRCVFVFAIPRAIATPVEIGGWSYEPPGHLLPCIHLLHHDPRIYSEPFAFRPERFLDDPPAPGTWLPWGGGRKRCPGLHLALLEMKVVLRTVLERVAVEPVARKLERPYWRAVVVTPHAGSRVRLTPRHRSASTGPSRFGASGTSSVAA